MLHCHSDNQPSSTKQGQQLWNGYGFIETNKFHMVLEKNTKIKFLNG